MKRQIYAPGTKAPEPTTDIPKHPYPKSLRPFNAWAVSTISSTGFPSELPAEVKREPRTDDKKRKADDSTPDEREILFDGVRFTAKRNGGSIELVDEENIGKGEGGWSAGKVLQFSVSKLDGTSEGKENGDELNFGKLKFTLNPISKAGFVSLDSRRPIAALPASTMAVDDVKPSEFPARLTAPPTVGSATETTPETKPSTGSIEYPAKGHASFREVVDDATLEKIQAGAGEFEGRKIQWSRASGE